MANQFDIIYKISADITGLKDGVNKAASAAQGLEKLAFSTAGALAGMFTVTAAVGFAKALIADADALKRLSDQTGISTQGLQRFQIAGDDAGNSVDQLTAAVTKMEDKLASGDKSALAALKKLQIPLEDIKNLSPENQFIAISEAIRKIQDPAQQVALAIDLFGKQGATVLPTLKRGFDDVKGAAVGMSDETIAALDEAGDMMEAFWRRTKAASATGLVAMVHWIQDGLTPTGHAMGEIAREADAAAAAMKRMTAAIPSAPKATGAPLTVSTWEKNQSEIENWIHQNDDAIKARTKSVVKDTAELDKATLAQEKFLDSVKDTTVQMNLSTFTLHRFGAFELPHVTSSLEGVDTELHTLSSTTMPDFGISIYDVGRTASTTFDNIQTNAQQMRAGIMQALQGIPQLLTNAFTGGGGIGGAGKALGSQIGGIVIKGIAGSAIGTAVGGAVAGGLTHLGIGVATAGMIGLSVATLGVGAAAIAAYYGIKKLLNDPEKKLNPIRQQFIDVAGGLGKLNEAAHAAGMTLNAILDAKNPQEYKKAVEDLTHALEFQNEAMQFLDDTVQKYGFSIEELGPKFAAQKLTDQAFSLEKEFRALESAGIDVETISVHMKDAINAYLQAALATGAAVPESMREILRQFAQMGLLTDANGNKIEDLEASGVHFSQTLDQQFSELIKTIKDLTDAISRGLGTAIANVPKAISIDGTINWKNEGDIQQTETTGATGGIVYAARGRILPFARGTDSVPAMLTPGEWVVNEDQQKQLASLVFSKSSMRGGGSRSAAPAASDVSGDIVLMVDSEVIGRIARRDVLRGGKALQEMRTIIRTAS